MKIAQHPALRRSASQSAGRCRNRRARGVTLVESAITLCVTAVLVSAAAPSFTQARERRHLEGVAAQVVTDIQYARSLAVARNESVRISFSSTGGASCYVVHTQAAGACSCAADGTPVCLGTAQALHTVRLDSRMPVQVSSNSSSMLFDSVKGTVTPTATVKVQGREATIHEVVNIMGRVRTCATAGALPGYRAC